MRFEAFTISTTTIITAATLLVTCSLAYAAFDKRISLIEQLLPERLARIEREIVELRQDVKELTALLASRKEK